MEILRLFIINFVEMFVNMSFYIMIGLFCVGLLNVFVKREMILKLLGKDKFSSVVNAAVVGVPLPLCSCGVVPTAAELKKDGASDGAVISFLISTPQTGVDSIFATYSLMGLLMAIYRPVAAFLSGIIGGVIINTFAKKLKKVDNVELPSCHCCSCHAEKKVEVAEEKAPCCCCHSNKPEKKVNKWGRVFTYGFGDFLDEIAIHFLVGVLLAALIATFVPADFFVNLGLNRGILAMLAMIIIGIPMYICSTSSIPIALSLVTKGLSLGSAFVFLFTGPVTNIASILILTKLLGKKITVMYLFIVAICSILFGLILDFIVVQFNFNILEMTHSKFHGVHFEVFAKICAIFFAMLLIKSLIFKKK